MKKIKLLVLSLALTLLLSSCGFIDAITGATKSDEKDKGAGSEQSETKEETKNENKSGE